MGLNTGFLVSIVHALGCVQTFDQAAACRRQRRAGLASRERQEAAPSQGLV